MDENAVPIKLPVHWTNPQDVISRYATNMLVQHTEDEFVISFFEIHPPIITPATEQLPEFVEAECVARIIVNENRLDQFIEALQTNLNNYREKQTADEHR